jgi:hypothetical protein
MTKLFRNFVTPLLIWEVIVIVSIALMYLSAGRTYVGPEGKRYLEFALFTGVLVVLLWLLFPVSRRKTGIWLGVMIGLVMPVVVGSIWAAIVDHWINSWGHYWTPLDARVEGLQLAVPSGIAGALIGFLRTRQAKSDLPPTVAGD